MRTAAALTSAGVIAAIGVVAFGELSSWAASRRGFPR
ncbi:YdcF family protein, partial [Burkholderia multivorans]